MRTVQCRTGVRGISLSLASACAALLLSACAKQSPVAPASDAVDAGAAQVSELNWARDALKRNPRIEIVATDTSAGVFTIRVKETGEVRAVKVNELAAVPLATLTAQARTPATTPTSTSEPTQQPQPATDPAKDEPASASPTSTPTSTMTASQGPATSSNYTIERTDGQVKVSGPGVSIVSTGTTTVTPSEAAANQRSIEPIICEGRRMLHLDDRNIYVDGNAIIARGGCELYITNSRITASGTGVVIGDAVVHIANSTIEGGAASFDASDSAKVYMRSSTFQGVPRRAENAVVQDQGGNQWQ